MDDRMLTALSHPIVTTACRRARLQPADRDEVLQEVVIKYLRAWRDGNEPDNAAAWLQTVTHRAIADHFRAQGRRREIPTREPADVVVEMFRESRATSFGAIKAKVVEQALGLLSPAEREVFQLRFLDDLPSAEVAARLGVTVNTVDQRARRARARFRDAFGAQPALLEELAVPHPRVY